MKSINGLIGVAAVSVAIPALFFGPAFIPNPYGLIFGVAMILLAVTGYGIALLWALDESRHHE